ncbi:AMP-binding protein [Nonomuraea sp. NPDC048916]|uniref:AMP-binding protein n=1 Tax=Nonomuraea sp. NPDC048916 TaxID=3154232 RepID=UPI0033D76BB2
MPQTAEHALYERFLRGLALSPRLPAMRVGADVLTYEEACERALRQAGALLAASPSPPRAVCVLAERGFSAYVGILAALFTGAAVVPLQPDFPALRTRRMLEDAGVSIVVADARGKAALAEAGLDLAVLDADRSPAAGVALDAPQPVDAGDVAYILFTSGSTGRPKGVPITHGSTHHYFQLMDKRYDFAPDDVFSQILDLNFDCAMFELFCAWGAGASALAVPPIAYQDLPKFINESGITVWFSTPSAITLVRRMSGLAPGTMPGLRWSFFAGEALRCSDAADWQAAAPGSHVENLYGPTELTITISRHRWDPETSPRLGVNGIVPIGTLHDGHDRLLLADEEQEHPAEGELCITGPQMSRGYLDPGDDKGRFLERYGRIWYRTGDRVRLLPGGDLAYLGRLDSQVQVQGWRVELAEVDHAVRACEGVEEAVTVTRETARGLELVVFYTGDSSLTAAALARQVRTVLPAGMLPKEYRHVEVMPLNRNRKIDRGRLARVAATG